MNILPTTQQNEINLSPGLLFILLISLGVCGNVMAQSPKSILPAKSTAPKKIVRLTPGYSLPDTARSPFFAEEKAAPPPSESQSFVEKLAGSLTITGITGNPEQPENARVIIHSKIYKVNDSIPVMVNTTLYTLVLVRVQFPGKVVLRYKDKTTVVNTSKPSKGVSP